MDAPELHAILRSLATEQRNPSTLDIDALESVDVLRRIHAEDRGVLDVVEAVLPVWAEVVDWVVEAFGRGARLIYVGAGTSGRLGVLDAAECPPTYSTPPEQVVGLIAGGHPTLVRSQEGVEDRAEDGAADVGAIEVDDHDVVVGISASRRTPYVLGALEEARRRGARTVFLVANEVDASLHAEVDRVVEVVTGPEAITGSTRMKAALAQKMMLTMLTTAAMVRAGKVYENLMVDVAPTSQKLRERAKGLVMDLGHVDYDEAARLLRHCDDEVRTAILMARAGLDVEAARDRLAEAGGVLRRALQTLEPGEDR